ncbi:probable protein arginine N-methyltransferase 6 isoform X2 [Amphibalanus amphitrite]|uniref:probable protein arginine N-methyltransferase 6 isoform X2 n=1 Tax=Amphibalanus amphitrite TaxID=1232801 RepID=UPI001C90F469|nr:probable protein arginine N-methyltransferase 6 isoform X2 [Amphibalanus amphitrite]
MHYFLFVMEMDSAAAAPLAPDDRTNGEAAPLADGGGNVPDTDGYFSSYESFEVHRLMVGDKPRTEAYRAAIQASRHLFQDKVVLDIGAGTGILSLFAAQAGARRVYAVEASGFHELARQNAERNGFGDVVRVVHGRIEDVALPEQADVIVSEWMGFYLLHESMLDSVIVGRDRFLAPDGVMFPDVARLYACPSTLAAFHCDQLQCWSRPYGLDLTAVGEAARRSMQQAPQVLDTHPEELLAAPELVLELHLQYVTAEELAAVTCRRFVTVTRPGPYRGLCLWFECHFPDGSRLDTAPRAPSTHWRQTAVVLPTDYPLEVDTVIGWELTLAREAGGGRKYRIALSMLDEDDEHPVPCGCAVGKCRLIKALIDKEDAECDEG